MIQGCMTAIKSVFRFIPLQLRGALKLRKHRLYTAYRINNQPYEIFRETQKLSASGETVILVIRFRLKLLRSSRFAHWVFQRLCICTTPFWSGLDGFSTKLWMVNPDTKDYLGIYDWRGPRQAQAYIDFLFPILKFFSVKGSVHASQLHGQDFEQFLTTRYVRQ